MKIIIIGGHLAPALSVLEALPKDAQVLFVGRKNALEGDGTLSLEYKTITDLKIPFVGLNTGRWQRKFTRFTLLSLMKIPWGVIQSFYILFRFRPDVVVGFGGYVSIPVISCAYLLRIPVVIHEQTMGAGVANRIVSRFAKKICISWDSSEKYFPKNKIVLTGNPIRKFSVLDYKFSLFKNKFPTIFVTGGSSGAHFVNVMMEEIIKDLLSEYNVIHQTGDTREYRDFDRLELLRSSLREQLRDNYILEKFIDPSEIGDLMTLSSLVISRSGMNTVTELIYFQKPAILIPLPFSQNGEQRKNAEYVKKIGLGTVLQQSSLNSKKLLQTINLMMSKIDSYQINVKRLKSVPVKNAVHNIISVINYVYESKKAKKY